MLPPSEAQSGTFNFVVSSYDYGSQSYYPVDTGNGTNLFQATRASLGGGSVVPSSFISGVMATYIFTIQIANPIL